MADSCSVAKIHTYRPTNNKVKRWRMSTRTPATIRIEPRRMNFSFDDNLPRY